MIEITRPLARPVVHARPEHLPEAVRHACVRDPAVAAMRARIRVLAEESLASDAIGVSVRLKADRKLGYHLDHCQGSEARPMRDDELDDKFRGQASLLLPAAQVKSLIGDCWRLSELDDLGQLATRYLLNA